MEHSIIYDCFKKIQIFHIFAMKYIVTVDKKDNAYFMFFFCHLTPKDVIRYENYKMCIISNIIMIFIEYIIEMFGSR